jgi:hypothetical protein
LREFKVKLKDGLWTWTTLLANRGILFWQITTLMPKEEPDVVAALDELELFG